MVLLFFICFYVPAIFILGVVGGGHMVSPLSIHTSILSVQSVCNKNGFHLISFEKISVLDSDFTYRYIII